MANKSLFPKDTTKVNTAKKKEKQAEAAAEADTTEPVEQAGETKPKKTSKKKVKVTAIKEKKPSMVEAALKVLSSAKEPMTCKDLIEAMTTKGLWTSPGGKTPANTLYSAFLRLIQNKGKQAAIRKADKGTFEINPSATA